MAEIKETTEEAERLKVFRKAEKMGQEEFGKRLGLDHSVISRYENNRLNIPIDFVKKLHEVFNISFEWFYTGKGNRKHTPEKASLIKDIKTLETNQQILTQQVEALKTELLKLHRDFHAFKANNYN
ncbi:helix-turn-helix transcriptional regulator [Pedobacter gandavensis]|uniref:helix-turn-helix domain-containing protein n=1 Tax=Pedobacter gandavensis TaxID=2679963 RepID=UPI0029303900|nr:helix-turn-helix transcriptional regulator [Pedobacter gandavensis]